MTSRLKIILLVALLMFPQPAGAIVNAIRAGIETATDKPAAIAKEIEEVEQAVQKAQDLKVQIGSVRQKIQKIVKDISDISLEKILKSFVFPSLAGLLTGETTDDTIIETVSVEMRREPDFEVRYSELVGIASLERSEAKQVKTNSLYIRSAVELYGKAWMMRKDLLRETSPDDNLETIESVMQATQDMQLRSLRRWNKILEMQSYINDFKAMRIIINYPLYKELRDVQSKAN